MSDEQIRRRFHAIGQAPLPPAPDRIASVHERIRNRHRNQLAALAAVAVIGVVSGGAVALDRVTGHGSTNKDVTTVSTISHAGLQLQTKAQHSPNDNRLVTIDAVLTGRSTTTARYGWIVYWGDGGYDRAYGSANCGDGDMHVVSDEHVFDHRYARSGGFTVRLQVTLCGQQQLAWSGALAVR